MKDYFEWNGLRSTVFGVHVTDQPGIIRAPERATFTNVPGRSGTLTTLEGAEVYDDFILPIDCTVRDLSRLSEIAMWLRGAGQLVTPEQPGGHYDARARLSAYLDTMAHHGLPIEENMVVYGDFYEYVDALVAELIEERCGGCGGHQAASKCTTGAPRALYC